MGAPRTGRPVYLNLFRIRLPLPGFVSILHRASGALLFLALPALLYLFQLSLASPDSFAAWRECLARPPAKLFLIGLLWAYLHHFCAGLRFLALDMHWGTALPAARLTSGVVLGTSLSLTALLGALLW